MASRSYETECGFRNINNDLWHFGRKHPGSLGNAFIYIFCSGGLCRRRWSCREIQMQKDLSDGFLKNDRCDDPHMPTAVRANRKIDTKGSFE